MLPVPVRRGGVTLLELAAVLALIAIFVALAAARLGPLPMGNHRAAADARRLALDLLQAQRRAIATGDNHYLEFAMNGPKALGYTIYQRNSGGGVTAVDAARTFPASVTVTPSHSVEEFNFEGSALAAYQITLSGPNREWRVSVVPLSGAVQVEEL
ncbi:MAG: prepilin-type N-terminal cleavage/methylation domain-containing protein [Pirellulales bacterium]